jgi:hypothetical protein
MFLFKQISIFSLLLIVFAGDVHGKKKSKKRNYSLLGMWGCIKCSKTSIIAFYGSGLMVVDGKVARFKPMIMNKKTMVLLIAAGDKWESLPYSINNSKKIKGSKTTLREVVFIVEGKSAKYKSIGRGEEYRLKGLRCSYSGKSSLNSIYSSTLRVLFDGKGNFKYYRETSSFKNKRIYFNKSKGILGMYRIEGKKIYLVFDKGGSGVATITMQTNKGFVKEIKYGGHDLTCKLSK